jgi:hypothetical protein
MREEIVQQIKKKLGLSYIRQKEVIQDLWSGYGSISRWQVSGGELDSLIVKLIQFPQEVKHPRGWNTPRSHLRKIRSYQVEINWYTYWAKHCPPACRIPRSYGSFNVGEDQLLLLEDLDTAGFSLRRNKLQTKEVLLCLKCLANFHAHFLNRSPEHLWEKGTYWHLDTRPDEWEAMEESLLKQEASRIDQILNDCQFQTFVHGDAKVANFCFSDSLDQVAVVDFQYVGKGCGMKDLAYFLGSCLSAEECESHEEELLSYYFAILKEALQQKEVSFPYKDLEVEWRKMYPLAWADFIRFLKGWMPEHQKINTYAEKMLRNAMKDLA